MKLESLAITRHNLSKQLPTRHRIMQNDGPPTDRIRFEPLDDMFLHRIGYYF